MSGIDATLTQAPGMPLSRRDIAASNCSRKVSTSVISSIVPELSESLVHGYRQGTRDDRERPVPDTRMLDRLRSGRGAPSRRSRGGTAALPGLRAV
ncbi:hypothetical protein [Haloechinothrix alba]|uniref:hypothetical protein n=1 Tax=Haloechinothrix alba TaxID=664784 RepID=UPI000B76F617|nr:hypothetical protein [Haloechinothrix alba]